MAKSVQPIVPGIGLPVTVCPADEKGYQELAVFRMLDGTTLSRWRLTWRERLLVVLRGDVYLWLLTNKRPLQSTTLIQVERPGRDDLARSQDYARRAAGGGFKKPDMESVGKAGTVVLIVILAVLAVSLVLLVSGVSRAGVQAPVHSREVAK
jgi:hypothetical protein